MYANIKCDTLFILSQEKLIELTESLRIVKRQVKLKSPKHLTGNGLRHQAATFSRLHSNHPQYQDFLASVLGHSLHVHKQNYQLPVGVLHKIMVCPILHSIMTGNKDKDLNGSLSNDSLNTVTTSNKENNINPAQPKHTIINSQINQVAVKATTSNQDISVNKGNSKKIGKFLIQNHPLMNLQTVCKPQKRKHAGLMKNKIKCWFILVKEF